MIVGPGGMKIDSKGSVRPEIFEQLEVIFGEELSQEYFLKKFEEPGKKFRKRVTDMSGRALKVLLAAHRVWDLHFRHQPHAIHFYWKSAKANNKPLGEGNQYLGEDTVADIIFFDGEAERNCFFIEIVILHRNWNDTTARIRWCRLWKERYDKVFRKATWEEERNHEDLMGESYIRI